VHYLLFCEKTADHKLRERPLALAHRQHLDRAIGRGELLLGVSLPNSTDGSALHLYVADPPAPAEAYAEAVPT
jgi:hypothetical protein